MKRSLLWILLLTLALVLSLFRACVSPNPAETPFVATAPVEPIAPVTYYDIQGTTAAELRKQLNQKGPVVQGNRFDGFTKWRISWNYQYGNRDGNCTIVSYDVNTKISITMPRWTNRANASLKLWRRWGKFINALQAHENNHARYSLQAAEKIKKMLGNLAPQATCNTLEDIANTQGQNILQANRERNAEYDRRTNHGQTEGVRFP